MIGNEACRHVYKCFIRMLLIQLAREILHILRATDQGVPFALPADCVFGNSGAFGNQFCGFLQLVRIRIAVFFNFSGRLCAETISIASSRSSFGIDSYVFFT